MQFPDLDEFRVYARPGTLNHVLGRIETVTPSAPGEYLVTTDLEPVGPDFPVPQSGVDLGALRSEGEECTILTDPHGGGAAGVPRARESRRAAAHGSVHLPARAGNLADSHAGGACAHPAFRSFRAGGGLGRAFSWTRRRRPFRCASAPMARSAARCPRG